MCSGENNPQEYVAGIPDELKPLMSGLTDIARKKLGISSTGHGGDGSIGKATAYTGDLTAGIDPLQKMGANIVAQLGRGKNYRDLGDGGLTQGVNPAGGTLPTMPTIPSGGGPSPYGGVAPTPAFSPRAYPSARRMSPYEEALRRAMQTPEY